MQKTTYSYQDICNSLIDVGLERGDNAYFTVSLGMLGICEGINDGWSLNRVFFDAIKHVVGEQGTIFLSAYSYSFADSNRDSPRLFDPLTTPSKTGAFSNFLLQEKGIIRSLDPMMSILGLGPNSKIVLENIPSTSFGRNCVYSRLLNLKKTKCVLIGLGPNWMPFLHHTDWLANVPFRYDKMFFGGIVEKNKIRYLDWNYSVRAPIKESRADAHQLGRLAVDAALWKSSPLGRAKIYSSDYTELFNFTLAHIKQNNWISAVGPKRRIFRKRQEPNAMPAHPWPSQLLREYAQKKRGLMDDEIFHLLIAAKKSLPVKLFKFKSGENLYDCVVPEEPDSKNNKFYPSEMYVGLWCLRKRRPESLLICAYLDSATDKNLTGFQIALSLIKKLSSSNVFPNVNIYLAMVPGIVGFSGVLTQLKRIQIAGVIHLVGNNLFVDAVKKSSNSIFYEKVEEIIKTNKLEELSIKGLGEFICKGNNPVASSKLSELPFDNICLNIRYPKIKDPIIDQFSIEKTSQELYQLINWYR